MMIFEIQSLALLRTKSHPLLSLNRSTKRFTHILTRDYCLFTRGDWQSHLQTRILICPYIIPTWRYFTPQRFISPSCGGTRYPKSVHRACDFIQGFLDAEKFKQNQFTPFPQPCSVCMLLSFAGTQNYSVVLTNVTQAYTQSNMLQFTVFIQTHPAFVVHET